MWFMVPLTFGVVCRDHILSSASSETTYTTLYTPHTLHYTHTHTCGLHASYSLPLKFLRIMC